MVGSWLLKVHDSLQCQNSEQTPPMLCWHSVSQVTVASFLEPSHRQSQLHGQLHGLLGVEQLRCRSAEWKKGRSGKGVDAP